MVTIHLQIPKFDEDLSNQIVNYIRLKPKILNEVNPNAHEVLLVNARLLRKVCIEHLSLTEEPTRQLLIKTRK